MEKESPMDWKACVQGGLVAGDAHLQEKARELLAMKTDHLSETWKAQQQLSRRGVVAAGLLAQEKEPRWRIWLRVEGLGEAKVDVARDLGYRDGGSVLQILKRMEVRCQNDREWKQKRGKYRQHLSSVED